MKKIVIISIIFFALPIISHADLANPEWFTKHCPVGQTEIECSFSNKESFVVSEFADGCKKYKDNPNYEILVGEGSTWGGRQRYCLVMKDSNTFFKFSLLVSVTTILSLFGLIKLRKKNVPNKPN